MSSDRISSGYRPNNSREDNVSQRRERQAQETRRREGSSPSRSDQNRQNPQNTQNRNIQAGTPADLAEAALSQDFQQQIQEAANLDMTSVQFVNAQGDTVYFTSSQLQAEGMWPNNNARPSAEGDVPEPQRQFGDQNSGTSHTGARMMNLGRGPTNNPTAHPNPSSRNAPSAQQNLMESLTQNQRMWSGFTQGQQMDDLRQQTTKLTQESEKQMVKVKMMALALCMHDTEGACRIMVGLHMDSEIGLGRQILTNLNKTREVKAMIMKQLATNQPPMNSGSSDPQAIATFQNRQAKYNQVLSLTQTSLQELSSSQERPAMDMMTDLARRTSELNEFLSSVKEQVGRANRAMTSAR